MELASLLSKDSFMSYRIRPNVRRAFRSFARSTTQSPYGYAFGPMPWIPHDLYPTQEGAPPLNESPRR
jgi:hypothetical protein